MPTSHGVKTLHFILIIHDLINEHKSGCRHLFISQTTLKNIAYIYYPHLLVLVITTLYNHLMLIILDTY